MTERESGLYILRCYDGSSYYVGTTRGSHLDDNGFLAQTITNFPARRHLEGRGHDFFAMVPPPIELQMRLKASARWKRNGKSAPRRRPFIPRLDFECCKTGESEAQVSHTSDRLRRAPHAEVGSGLRRWYAPCNLRC